MKRLHTRRVFTRKVPPHVKTSIAYYGEFYNRFARFPDIPGVFTIAIYLDFHLSFVRGIK